MNEPLILVGPLPRPYGGVSVLFELLRDEMVARGIRHRIIDIAERRPWPLVPRFVQRTIDWLAIGARYIFAATRRRTTVYLTVAQSAGGFLRDAMVITYAAAMRHRVVLHVNCGGYGAFFEAQPRWMQEAIRRVLRLAETIIVPSARLVSMFDFDPSLRSRIEVIFNAAPAADDWPEKTPPNGEVRLLFLSNFIATKGYEEVIRTVGILRREHNMPATCRMVGGFFASDAPALMRRMIDDEMLDEHVKILPEAGRASKYEILRDSHFLLLPTRWRGEAQPVSIIEALAAGCVPVAPEYRAIPDLIVDGHTGILAGPDPSDIARAIAALCADRERYTQMSRSAVAHHRQLFTTGTHLQSMLNVLIPATASPQSDL